MTTEPTTKSASKAKDRSHPLLAVLGLSKTYGTTRVVNDVSVAFYGGTVHALLGENGAGKSTLIKMVSGVVHPDDEGRIEYDGSAVRFRSVSDAQAAGIVALPQELSLVAGMSVADNIYLGTRLPGTAGFVDDRQLRAAAESELGSLGQTISARAMVRDLSPVQQTMVAIARALVRKARVLILDEPTAALTDAETEQLFAVIRRLRDRGVAIIYVSHRLEEVFELADTATVMRNGSVVWTRPVSELDTTSIVTAMIGRAPAAMFPSKASTVGQNRLVALELTGRRIQSVTIKAKSGRILGIAGLAGSGRSELLRTIAGAQKPASGTVTVDGATVQPGSVARAMAAGIAYVPEERRSQGLIGADSISRNIAMASLAALARLGFVSSRRERDMAERASRDLRIKSTSVAQPVSELSGGNQQKVVLAKFLERRPKVLLLDEPTRGIDVGTKAEIYALLRRLADEGMALVVVSSELPELLGLADEIAVLREGHIVGTVHAADSSESTILELCYGSTR